VGKIKWRFKACGQPFSFVFASKTKEKGWPQVLIETT
jgi:hypothetical protein